MSTSSLHHRPAPTAAAAAAAVLAIVVGGLGLALARNTGSTSVPGAPTDAPQQSVTRTHHDARPVPATVSGGRVQVGR